MFLTLAPPPYYLHGNRNGESSGPLRPTGVLGENKLLVQLFPAELCRPARLRHVQTRTTSALTNQRNGSGHRLEALENLTVFNLENKFLGMPKPYSDCGFLGKKFLGNQTQQPAYLKISRRVLPFR